VVQSKNEHSVDFEKGEVELKTNEDKSISSKETQHYERLREKEGRLLSFFSRKG